MTIYVTGAGNEFGTLNLTTEVYTPIGTLDLPPLLGGMLLDNIYGMGYGADGNLYGVDSQTPATNNSDAHLWQINTATASVSDEGSIGVTAVGAAVDASGKMYRFSQDSPSAYFTLNPPSNTTDVVYPGGITSTGLMAVTPDEHDALRRSPGFERRHHRSLQHQPDDGLATPIGDTGFSVISGLFVNGTLYGFDDLTNAIVTIDTSTGVATQVGSYFIGGSGQYGDAIYATAPIQAAAVPEPSSILLGVIATVACGSLGLLRRRSAAPVA